MKKEFAAIFLLLVAIVLSGCVGQPTSGSGSAFQNLDLNEKEKAYLEEQQQIVNEVGPAMLYLFNPNTLKADNCSNSNWSAQKQKLEAGANRGLASAQNTEGLENPEIQDHSEKMIKYWQGVLDSTDVLECGKQ